MPYTRNSSHSAIDIGGSHGRAVVLCDGLPAGDYSALDVECQATDLGHDLGCDVELTFVHGRKV